MGLWHMAKGIEQKLKNRNQKAEAGYPRDEGRRHESTKDEKQLKIKN